MQKGVAVTQRLWVLFPFEGMNLYLSISICSVWHQGKSPTLNSWNAWKKSAQSVERIVLTQIPSGGPAVCGIPREADTFNTVVAQGPKCVTVNATDCGLDIHLLTFIFSFLRCGVEAKRGVELRHSTPNASTTQRKVGNGVS